MTHSSLHQVKLVRVSPAEVGMPELQCLLHLGLGQGTKLWLGHLSEPI